MAALSEVWMVMQWSASFGVFLLVVRFAPYVVDQVRATVRGLEGLLLDCVSLARTSRRLLKIRQQKRAVRKSWDSSC